MKHNESKKYFGLLTKIGGTMLASILFFFLIGLKLEQLFPSKGLIAIGFMFLGLVTGFFLMYLTLRSFFTPEKEESKTENT